MTALCPHGFATLESCQVCRPSAGRVPQDKAPQPGAAAAPAPGWVGDCLTCQLPPPQHSARNGLVAPEFRHPFTQKHHNPRSLHP